MGQKRTKSLRTVAKELKKLEPEQELLIDLLVGLTPQTMTYGAMQGPKTTKLCAEKANEMFRIITGGVHPTRKEMDEIWDRAVRRLPVRVQMVVAASEQDRLSPMSRDTFRNPAWRARQEEENGRTISMASDSMDMATAVQHLRNVSTDARGRFDRDLFRVLVVILVNGLVLSGEKIGPYYSQFNTQIRRQLGVGHSLASCLQFFGGKKGRAALEAAKDHLLFYVPPAIITGLIDAREQQEGIPSSA